MLPVLVLAALAGHHAAAVFVGGVVLFALGRALEEVPSEPSDPATARPVAGRIGVSLPPHLDLNHTNSTGPQ